MWIATYLLLWPAAPAHAIVDGFPLQPRALPWLGEFGGCGATLIGAERALTAAHCVAGTAVGDLPSVRFGDGERRRVERVALAPPYVAALAANRVNSEGQAGDLALLRLDRPVRRIAPLPLATRLRTRLRAVGRGDDRATGRARLRGVDLRPIADAACRAFYVDYARAHDPAYAHAFAGRSMLCAADPDGRAPYRSTCFGDSGGPLLSPTASGWRLAAVTSWGGDRCGADGDPSVFTEVRAWRAFITARHPVWGPRAGSRPATITGDARPGGTLTCSAPPWRSAPDFVLFDWVSTPAGPGGGAGKPLERQRGTGATYVVRPEDAGRALMCTPIGVGRGGVEPARPEIAPIGA